MNAGTRLRLGGPSGRWYVVGLASPAGTVVSVAGLDFEGGGGVLGAFFGGPLQESYRVEAGRGFAGRAEWVMDARVVLDALGSVGQWAGGLGGWGAVVGQEVHAGLPQYREPLGCGVQRDEVAAFPGSCRFHALSVPRPVAGYADVWAANVRRRRRARWAASLRVVRLTMRLISAAAVSGIRPGSAGGGSSGAVGRRARVVVRGRAKAAATAQAASAAMARARCRQIGV
jgi:hypothetical protein